MYKNRIIAWSCGILAALLVIMAGKSCMQPMDKPVSKKSSDNASISITEASEAETKNVVLDMFGRPVVPSAETPQSVTDEEGNIVEPETDEEGNVIEPTVEAPSEAEILYATDAFGTIIGTEPLIIPDENSEELTEEVTEETTDLPPGFSGYDHNRYDNEGKIKATMPPDFVIIID